MISVPMKCIDKKISAGDEDSTSLGKIDETDGSTPDDTVTQPKGDITDSMPNTTHTTDDLQKLAEFNLPKRRLS